MLIVVAIIKAQAGKEKEIEEALVSMIPQAQSEEGTLEYILHRAQNEPQKFLIYEKYKDKESFEYHSSTPQIKELFAKVGPLLDGPPSIEIYDLIASKNQ